MDRLILLLATILAGECGPLPSPFCQESVARVAIARVGAPGYADNLEDVLLDGFYGRATPDSIDFDVARLAVTDPDALTSMASDTYLYVISETDRRRLHFPGGDTVIIGPAGLRLHFYCTWPHRR